MTEGQIPDIEMLDRLGYICHDPDCTASHVDIEALPPVEFVEGEL